MSPGFDMRSEVYVVFWTPLYCKHSQSEIDHADEHIQQSGNFNNNNNNNDFSFLINP